MANKSKSTKTVEYVSKGKTTKISVTSRASVKLRDNYFTFEYAEEKEFPANEYENINFEIERKIMWEDANSQVDKQIQEVIELSKQTK